MRLAASTLDDPTASFLGVRTHTDLLTDRLSAEDQTVQSMPDASPTTWHRAHTSWFFEEFILGRVAGYRCFDESFRYLFNSYYEAVGDRQPRSRRGVITRPGVSAVTAYRQHVTEELARTLASGALDDPALGLVELGRHHEQQHQELLLMDLKHLLSCNRYDPVYVERSAETDDDAPLLSWRTVDGGLHDIGHRGSGFAFDNEGPRHTVHLESFQIGERAVTNQDWAAFVADGGYTRADLWLSDGWARVQTEQWRAPEYWRLDDDGWTTFTLSGRRPLRRGEPVCHVSFYEADAFARWAGARLPTEQEWEVAAAGADGHAGRLLDPGRCHPGAARVGMLGDVWEWTSSAYLPYPGFRPAGGAVGEYNGKFMCDQHVLRGGSAVTPEGHDRMTYRNFFPAHARWPFTGLRLAR
jgi:ergothioneine biosynthesis protein EgtB